MGHSEEQPSLIARAAGGERAALEELLLAHYDRLANRIAGKIPDDLSRTISVEDVIQETFLEVVHRIGTFAPTGDDAFYRWLATIAEHQLIDMIRALRAAKRGGGRSPLDAGGEEWASAITDLLGMLAPHDRTPSRSAAAHEAAEAIREALDEIDADYAEALRLRYAQGLAVEATAQEMGRTKAAVHMLCHRGLLRLRDALGRESKFLSRKA